MKFVNVNINININVNGKWEHVQTKPEPLSPGPPTRQYDLDGLISGAKILLINEKMREVDWRNRVFKQSVHRLLTSPASPEGALPYYAMPYHTILYHTRPYHTILCHTIPYHIILFHTLPHLTTPYHTIPHHTTPYHKPWPPYHVPI